MLNNLICPISSERTDSNVSRLTTLINAVLVLVFIFTLQSIPLYIAAIDYAIRAFTNGDYSPIRLLAFSISKMLGLTPKMVDKAPKVFASRLGFLCLLVSSILINLNMSTASISVAAMATSLFLLDSVGNFCVGCLIYHHLVFPFFKDK